MIIQQLHIYGFGKHVDKVIPLQNSMNIFYGLNEAGKTTIQQFILQIFFGFPAKNSTLLKYEPKTALHFGGQIQLLHSKYGVCTIERVKGKMGGDVTVRLQDGTVGQEDLLRKVLYGYSRNDFEAIFAFSLHELQGIEKMSEEELSRVLLASGTTGVDQLTTLERQLEKNMNGLYKRNGKNPTINKKLDQLKQTERQIQQYQTQIASYEQKVKRLKEVEQLIASHQEQQLLYQRRWKNVTITKQALPLLYEKQSLEQQLATYKVTSFPVDGIRRFETFQDKAVRLQAIIAQLEKQQQDIEMRLSSQLDDERFTKLQQLLEKESEWHHLLAHTKSLQDELELLKLEQNNHFRLLGIERLEDKQQLITQNVSLQEEERFQVLVEQLEQLEEQQKQQLLIIERLRDELDEVEQRLAQLRQSQPSSEERYIVEGWPAKQLRLEQLKVQEQASKQTEVASNHMSLLLIVLATSTLLFGLWQKSWPVIIVGVILLVTSVQFFRMRQQTKQTKEQASNLRQMLHEIRELEQESLQIATLKERVHRYDEREQLLQEQRQVKLVQYKNVELTLAQLDVQLENSWEDMQQFLRRFCVNGVTQRKLLPELFTRVREIQRLAIVIDAKQTALESNMHLQEAFIDKATLLTSKPCTKESLFIYVRNVCHALEEQKNEAVHLQQQLQQKTAQLEVEKAEYFMIKNELYELFTLANVEEEGDFYEAEKQFVQYTQLHDRLRIVMQQLSIIALPIMTIIPTEMDLQQQLVEIQENQTMIQQKLDQLLEEKAQLQYSTAALLTDEAYGQLLQVFEEQKAELAELVKSWSIYKAVTTSIQQTMHTLREEKLPKVLKQVNQLFSTLTGGKYNKLLVNEQGYFEVLATDGTSYHIAELSQATKEQAYVALRLALAESLKEVALFPLMMDDPFVHFDRNRMHYMIQLMKEVKNKRQILYFTCHTTLYNEWQDQDVIMIDLSCMN